MKVELKELAGFGTVLENLSLAQRKSPRSTSIAKIPDRDAIKKNVLHYGASVVVNKKDIEVIKLMIEQGKKNVRPLRGIIVYLRVTASVGWWENISSFKELQTLFSDSSSVILKRDKVQFTEKDFVPGTPKSVIEEFNKNILQLYNEELSKVIPRQLLQTRDIVASYHDLRTIYFETRSFISSEYPEFFKAIRELPFAEDLIFLESNDE
jgi:hypothetical protein